MQGPHGIFKAALLICLAASLGGTHSARTTQSDCDEFVFLPFVPIQNAISPQDSLVIHDIDGDGYLDIASGSIIAFGRSAPFTFDVMSFGTQFDRVWAVIDVTNDGQLDLVVSSFFGVGGLSLVVQTAPRQFAPVRNVTSGAQVVAASAGDVNGDGIIDLVAVTSLGENPGAKVYFGQGSGFSAGTAIPTVSQPAKVYVGDVVGDSLADIVTGNTSPAGVEIFAGRQDASFGPSVPLPLSGRSLTGLHVEDVNGDGFKDVIAGVLDPTVTTRTTLFKNHGVSGFARSLQSPYGIGKFAVGDFNGDDRKDILIPTPNLIYVQNTEGVFTLDTSTHRGLGGGGFSIDAMDFDRDGKPDLIDYSVDQPMSVARNACGMSQGVVYKSAASFDDRIARGAICVAFGSGFSTTTAIASTLPLPTMLGDLRMYRLDSSGNELAFGLFYVSPTQVNFLIPEAGIGPIVLENQRGQYSVEYPSVAPGATALFSANSNGQGVASGYCVRVHPDGSQELEQIVSWNGQQYVPRPIDLDSTTDKVFLVVFGTGFRTATSGVVTVGTISFPTSYVGPAPGYAGLDQANAEMPRTLRGRGTQNLTLRASGTSNVVTVNIK